MGSSLQDPWSLPSFQLSTGGVVPRNTDGFPCDTRDFQVDRQKWVSDITVANQRTVRGILRYRNGVWLRRCFYCEQGPSRCPQGPCVQAAHRDRLSAARVEKFESTDLFQGEMLDEYFGELIPPREAAGRNDDNYSFQIRNVASSSARDYGNWTRFVNHSCRDFNVEAVNDVLGGRRTITFRALRNIEQGEELFIDYGLNYFGDAEGEILCQCSSFPQGHVPTKQVKRARSRKAVPGPQAQLPLKNVDVTVDEQNDWIARNKAWLGERHPNGYSRWTMVHWRLLEQLIRRRQDIQKWRSEYKNLPSSRDDPLLAFAVQRGPSQVKIRQWHLDIIKAFQQDKVCGMREGKQWETNDILKRIFAVLVAARRRRRKAKGKKKISPRTTPPLIQRPVTPETSKAAPGTFLTPPPTVRPEKGTGGDVPDLPTDLPTPPPTVRQASRASARGRRHQRRSYNPY